MNLLLINRHIINGYSSLLTNQNKSFIFYLSGGLE